MNERVKIKNVADFIRTGKTPPTKEHKYFNGDIQWYTPGDLDKTKHLHNSIRSLTTTAFTDKKAVVFPKGTLLVACIGDIGKLGITTLESSSNQQITGIKPKKNVNVNYLYYWFRYSKKTLQHVANNAVVPILNNRSLEKIKIPLPPLAEQQKIAAILDAADQLRQKDQQLIDHYTSLSQSLFLEMFGDYFKNKSCYREILQIANFIDYRGKTPKRTNIGIPLISAKSVRIGYFDKSRLDFISQDVYNKIMTRGFPKVGDVLFTTEGATMGFTCRIPLGFNQFAVGQRIITLQPNNLYNSILLEFVLNSIQIQGEIFRQATGSAIKGIRSARFAKILIPTPPIALQNQFAQHIEKIEQQKQYAQASREQSETLFNSLLQRAFKGELT